MRGGGNSKTELYICGNPPYLGWKFQNHIQKSDLEHVLSSKTKNWRKFDYVTGWLIKASEYNKNANSKSAFVVTNSITQGISLTKLWPHIFETGNEIFFAYTSFKWANLAARNAGVTVVIVGLTTTKLSNSFIYSVDESGQSTTQIVDRINANLQPGQNIVVPSSRSPISAISCMDLGNVPKCGGNLIFTFSERESKKDFELAKHLRGYVGSVELIRGIVRYCLWIPDNKVPEALQSNEIVNRIEGVRQMRLGSKAQATRVWADYPHRFIGIQGFAKNFAIVNPVVSSESRKYLPVGLVDNNYIVSSSAFAIYDQPLWNLALIASRLHLVWIKTVCGKLETRFRYSNTLGWNTFPVPKLTSKNKEDLTRATENILLAREEHFPATIADMYKPDQMPENLRFAHERNDEIIERIFIGRRFKNDTERLEKLFELYSKMTDQKEQIID